MSNLDFEEIKKNLKEIPPIWAICILIFVIYLLENHIYLASFVIFGFLVTIFFKKHGVIVLSIIADIADYMGAAVPIVGDFLDVFIVIIQSSSIGCAERREAHHKNTQGRNLTALFV